MSHCITCFFSCKWSQVCSRALETFFLYEVWSIYPEDARSDATVWDCTGFWNYPLMGCKGSGETLLSNRLWSGMLGEDRSGTDCICFDWPKWKKIAMECQNWHSRGESVKLNLSEKCVTDLEGYFIFIQSGMYFHSFGHFSVHINKVLLKLLVMFLKHGVKVNKKTNKQTKNRCCKKHTQSRQVSQVSLS